MGRHDRQDVSRGGATSRGLSWLVPAVMGLAALALLAVLIGRGGAGGGGGETVGSAQGVSHVHGLGINPGDGELYAATHHGVFRVPAAGEAALVSVPRDTMGFTVVGDDHFLGSGHPAFQGDPLFDEDERPLLGLIESTDGGTTWEALSLSGEADFHALEAAHGNVYGFDGTSGRFLVSADGETWDTRSERTALSDFAVDPDDAERLVAMTDAGLAESTDGARSWVPIDGPPVVFLSWDADAGLWGVDSNGAVHVRRGSSWEERGDLPGPPQAFLATATELYAAASDGERTGIYVSDDGQSWQLRYADGS